MNGYLLDTNLLIALFWPSHVHHDHAIHWFVKNRGNGWATCSMTQAGFVRIVSNPAFSRDAVRPLEAVQLLEANTSAKDHSFWPGVQTLAESITLTDVRLMGHQQVTDVQLLGLAMQNNGKLATLDRRIEKMLSSGSLARKALEVAE